MFFFQNGLGDKFLEPPIDRDLGYSKLTDVDVKEEFLSPSHVLLH